MDKYVSRLSEDGPFILLFHGVVDENHYEVRNHIRKHIEKDYFAELLKSLARNGVALSIDEVVAIHKSGKKYPPNSFVITFDDGFENNYSVAAPVLADLNIPSVFYVTTDFIEKGTMSWTDKVEYCLENIQAGEICLPWDTEPFVFKNNNDKLQLMKKIRKYIFQNQQVDVHEFTSLFFEALGVNMVHTTDDPLDKKMSWEQVKQLNSNPLFTIGGHTHTHIVMSFVPHSEMEAEVDLSINLLRDRANINISHYAYPQGQANHYSPAVVDYLQRKGICCCPTAIDGQNTRETGLFDLYRTMII